METRLKEPSGKIGRNKIERDKNRDLLKRINQYSRKEWLGQKSYGIKKELPQLTAL